MSNNSREDQWFESYEHHQIQDFTPCSNATNMASSSGSSLGDGGAVTHEVAGKRSRASRRAIPTTLLNANPSNFRSLVQKFTGRSAGGQSNRRKGPLTLDFGSPTTVSKETIFPVSSDRSNYNSDHVVKQYMSNEKRHVTFSGTDSTMSYQSGEEMNSVVYGSRYDDHDHELPNLDYYHDFHSAALEEFMMKDLDL